MPDMLADTCQTLCCYKLVVENAVLYRRLVSKKCLVVFFPFFIFMVVSVVSGWLFLFSLISSQVGNLVM